jgi:TolB-like protein/class 3 adenylate cyclase/Tfp pilus assembly protein PilF
MEAAEGLAFSGAVRFARSGWRILTPARTAIDLVGHDHIWQDILASWLVGNAAMTARVERRLAAIMAVDIVGYSHLIELDEDGTLAAIKLLRREIIDPLLADHHGRIAKLMGDGAIVEFGSVVDALACAVAIQKEVSARQTGVGTDRRIVFRIGINLGDVVVEDGDLLGDGVNIAARLEGLAEPGGILVSSTVHDHLQGRLSFHLEDLGDRSLKNIARPVRVYRVGWQSRSAGEQDRAIPTPPALPDRASIAVLPFTNMSSDPEQEYFADGLAEDLITDLSKVPGLLVIARNSSFAYKGGSADLRLVANGLGVRYVVEGSVRRAATRVRINAQLIDASDNSHLWADRFDRDLADIFHVQDEIVGRIVTALADILPSARPVVRRRATNLDAYDLFVRGRVLAPQSPESNKVARDLLEEAIELDPDFAEAHVWLAMSYWFVTTTWGEGVASNREQVRSLAQKAMSLDPNEASAHMILGYIHLYGGEWREAVSEFEAALRINPNHADTWALLSDWKVYEGQAAEAVNCIRKAISLNPHPPGYYYWLCGWAQYGAGQYDDAIETLRREETYRSPSRKILAASLAQLGRMDEAHEEARQFLAMDPQFSVRRWSDTQPFQDEKMRQHFMDGYIKAGLPG